MKVSRKPRLGILLGIHRIIVRNTVRIIVRNTIKIRNQKEFPDHQNTDKWKWVGLDEKLNFSFEFIINFD